jgi:hypothetical protein
MHVAFVLLPHVAEPDADAIATVYAELFPEHGALVPAGDNEADDGSNPGFGLACRDGVVHVVLAPDPVPDGEAERAAQRSMAAIGGEGAIPPHAAHLIVPWFPNETLTLVEGLSAQARVTAAIALATGAVGVYVGAASATHPAEWYVAVARELDDPLMLWLGVSHAVTPDERHSFLSFGMQQFSMQNLLLSAPLSEGGEALEYFYALLGSCAESGSPLVPGEIIGREPGELLTVRDEPSPIDDEQIVSAIDL